MQITCLSEFEAFVLIPQIDPSQPVHPFEFDILGLTVIEHTLKALEKKEAEHVTFLMEWGIDQLQNLLGRIKPWQMSFSFIQNTSLETALQSYHLLPPANGLVLLYEPLVFDPVLVEKMLAAGQGKPGRVLSAKNNLLAYLSPDLLKTYIPAQLLSGGNTLSKQTYLRPTYHTLLCSAARDISDVRVIEKSLVSNLTKPNDGWVSLHLNRPVSTLFSRLLARRPIK